MRRRNIREFRPAHPHFRAAVAADARLAIDYRMEGDISVDTRIRLALQIIRLMWVSDAFFGQMCYRAKARLQDLHVPVLPSLFHHVAQITAQITIGDPVYVEPGVYIADGQVVVDGVTTIGSGVILFPWVTIGLRAGSDIQGPIIEYGASIGTGAKVIGPVRVGREATVGANAVVVSDVDPCTTVVGVPARLA